MTAVALQGSLGCPAVGGGRQQSVNPVPSASKAQENSHQSRWSVEAQIAHISLYGPEWISVACVSIAGMTCCSHLRQGKIRERPQWSCIKVFLWNMRDMTVTSFNTIPPLFSNSDLILPNSSNPDPKIQSTYLYPNTELHLEAVRWWVFGWVGSRIAVVGICMVLIWHTITIYYPPCFLVYLIPKMLLQ